MRFKPTLLYVLILGAAAAVTAGCDLKSSMAGTGRAPARAADPPRLHFTDQQEPAGLRFTHTDGGSGRKYFIEQFCSGCAFFDYDNDGYLDVYAVNGAPLPGTPVSSPPPRHELFRYRRDGSFENVTDRAGVGSTRFGGGVCAGDFDNDGFTDLYVTTFGKNHLYRNQGNGTFRDVAES